MKQCLGTASRGILLDNTSVYQETYERDTQHEGASRRRYRTRLLTSCNSSNTIPLTGAGSTFVYPVMGRWIQDFQQSHTNVRINYQSIGSGGGIQQVKSGTIDFGASDAPLSDSDWRRWPGGPISGIGRAGMCHLQPGAAESAAALFGHAGGNFPGQDHELARSGDQGRIPGRICLTRNHRGSPRRKQRHQRLHHLSCRGQPGVGADREQRHAGEVAHRPGAKGSEGVTGQVKQSPGASATSS